VRFKRLLIFIPFMVVAACACSRPAPSAAENQASSGPGWELVAQKPNGRWPDLRITPTRDSIAAVVLTVAPGCPATGESSPSFTGFTVDGDVIMAVVSRTPITSRDPCLATVGVEFDIQLDLQTVPASVRTMILAGEACPSGDDSCASVSASMPIKGFASPSS
jgi:hypothetical protein